MIEHGMPAQWTQGPLKHETVSVFPVGADELGIYALNPEAPWPWPSPPIHASQDDAYPEHTAAQLELIQHCIDLGAVPILHSTSWRAEPLEIVVHYLAVVDVDGMVRESWPHAKPISPRLAEVAGQPKTHAAAAPPEEVRYIDILRHAIRHLRFLTDPDSDGYDATIARSLPSSWHPHMPAIRPATAHMFGRIHDVA